MSTEDDLATIERVTAALAGPLKVWVLREDAAGQVTVWLTHDAALQCAREHMKAIRYPAFTAPDIDAFIDRLRRVQYVEVGVIRFELAYVEVGG